MTDLSRLTPVEVDTLAADAAARYWSATDMAQRAAIDVYRVAGAKKTYGRGPGRWSMTLAEALAAVKVAADWDTRADGGHAARTLGRFTDAQATVSVIQEERDTYEAEFDRRGGWTRAFLVTDGHAHATMACSSCNKGDEPTRFTWLVEFSGKTEAEVVDAAGMRACTVCYPTAPVGDRAGASRMFTPEERTRAEQRDAAATAKAERLAARIAKGLTPDGSEFQVSWVESHSPGWERDDQGQAIHVTRDREKSEWFKTERAAVSWVVQYGDWDNGLDGDKAPAFAAVIEAVAAKHNQPVAEVRTEIELKITARRKRNGG